MFYKGVSPPFTLVKGQPYEEISKSLVNGSIHYYKDVLLHVTKESTSECDDEDLEILEYFATPFSIC